MIQPGNTKLGPRVWTWSLPAVATCPGASEGCLAVCYARKGRYVFKNVKEAYTANWKSAEEPAFAPWMLATLRANCVDVLRVHASGDLYSNDYIQNWITIANKSVRTEFYAYTRSWQVPELRAAIRRLGRLENFTLFLSTDRTMPKPPRWKGIPICYLSADDSDQPRMPVDLVFRAKQSTVMKRTSNGSLVCCYDNGVTPVTCSQCQLCWAKRLPKNKHEQTTTTRQVREHTGLSGLHGRGRRNDLELLPV
jgi:hypothetical protein